MLKSYMGETKIQVVKRWLDSAKRNVSDAKANFKVKRYDWSLFIWHLAIEKVIKAIYLSKGIQFPYIHDLSRLVDKLNLKVDESMKDDLDEITTFCTEARYDDVKYALYKKATEKYSKIWVNKCEKYYKFFRKFLDEKNN